MLYSFVVADFVHAVNVYDNIANNTLPFVDSSTGNNNVYRYEKIKSEKCSTPFSNVIDKSFNIIPVIYDIRKDNSIDGFIGNFDKNLSFDIIGTLLSAA
jgi:hypothetical protein